jgi:TetR/AcrR family transcriptional repressor of nem operon
MTRRLNVEARQRILRTAYELFASEGYEAVSMERVADALGMKKATLFYYYPSKEALGKAVVQAAARRYAEGIRAVFSDPRRDPADAVRSLFDYGFASGRKDCSRGCFIGKMGQELSERHLEMRRSVSDCMREWRRELALYLGAWKRRGYFRQGFSAPETADGILSLYEGGVLLARVVQEEAPVEHARRVAVRIVVSWRG